MFFRLGNGSRVNSICSVPDAFLLKNCNRILTVLGRVIYQHFTSIFSKSSLMTPISRGIGVIFAIFRTMEAQTPEV